MQSSTSTMPHVPIETLAVGAAVAGAAAVVDVQVGETPAGPELDAEVEIGGRHAGRAAVALDDQRWLLALGRNRLRRGWRVEDAVRLSAVRRRPADRLRDRDRALGDVDLHRISQGGVVARLEVERDHLARLLGRRRDHQGLGGVLHLHAVEHGEGRVVALQLAALGGEAADRPLAVLRPRADDAAVRGEVPRRHAEDPLRHAELGLHRAERGDLVAARVGAVEVPPAGAVGDEDEVAVGRPAGLEDRLAGVAGDMAQAGERAVRGDVRFPQLGAVPRHQRVVPGEPCELGAVGGEGGGAHEVGAGEDDRAAILVGALEAEHDDGVDRLGVLHGVVLADGEEAVAGGVEEEVGVAPAGVVRGDRLRVAFADAVEAAVGVVGDDHDAVASVPHAAAVLVHGGADVHLRRGDRLGVVDADLAHEAGAATFGGAGFQPVAGVAVAAGLVEADGLAGQHLRGDWRGPGAVGDGGGGGLVGGHGSAFRLPRQRRRAPAAWR